MINHSAPQEFSGAEAERHNALTERGWALIKNEILLDEPVQPGKPNWLTRRKLYQAIDCFEQALEINPAGWQSMFAIGKIYQRLEESEKAFLFFERAHRLNPQQSDVAREAGLAALDVGRSREALNLCAIAVELNPDDAGLVANLAWAQLIAGDVPLAQETIQKAVAAAPNDKISQDALRIINEIHLGNRPLPKTLLEISTR